MGSAQELAGGPVSFPPPYSPYIDDTLTARSGYVQTDGRVNINLESKIAQTLSKIIDSRQDDIHNPPPEYSENNNVPDIILPLNIVVQVVGSRGDVQPFVALGNALQRFGHRVRIATHSVFANFVRDSGLEFFSIGGDPAELMAYMVKNPGLIPRMKSLRDGEVLKKQAMVASILDGCWRSCIENDPITQEPFVADAIIANPPSFAYVHCAQALSIPVHLVFTMPWTSTKAFPHPLADLQPSSMHPRTANWVSYGVVEWLTWQGLGGVINQWRASIDLDPIPTTEGPMLAETLKIPFTYCWSAGLVPKPRDWPAHIDVCGFFFRDPPSYEPAPDLKKLLQAGSPIIYFGFGSIVVDNPAKLIDIIVSTVAQTGIRAIVSKGWSNLIGPPNEQIYYIDDCPHEWLFQHVAAVVHHGGAGTTACGLLNGRPTVVVPFFGDQHFWARMVFHAGAGPAPIPYASLTVDNLTTAVRFCLTPNAEAAAQKIAVIMKAESGVDAAVDSFHRNLPTERMRCHVMPNQAAVWTYKRGERKMNLSKATVQTLIDHNKIDPKHLRGYELNKLVIENRRWDPLTGVMSAATKTGLDVLQSTGEMLYNPYKEFVNSRSPRPSHPANPTDSVRDETSAPPSLLSLERQDSCQRKNSLLVAGNMAGATLKGFGKFTGTYFRGVVVDIPHAAAEGFRQVPRLYGEKPKDYGEVRDWKSGALMGGRNFVDGMTDGFTGIFTQPVKGARVEGPLGAAKGFAKGTIGLATKVPSAGIGLIAYPFHGITKSIEAVVRSKSRRAIVNARLIDGYRQTQKMQMSEAERYEILRRFERLCYSLDP